MVGYIRSSLNLTLIPKWLKVSARPAHVLVKKKNETFIDFLSWTRFSQPQKVLHHINEASIDCWSVYVQR